MKSNTTIQLTLTHDERLLLLAVLNEITDAQVESIANKKHLSSVFSKSSRTSLTTVYDFTDELEEALGTQGNERRGSRHYV